MNEMKAKLKALELAGLEATKENVEHYEDCGYLTINKGRNGKVYAYYLDGDGNELAVNTNTLSVITDKKYLENIF